MKTHTPILPVPYYNEEHFSTSPYSPAAIYRYVLVFGLIIGIFSTFSFLVVACWLTISNWSRLGHPEKAKEEIAIAVVMVLALCFGWSFLFNTKPDTLPIMVGFKFTTATLAVPLTGLIYLGMATRRQSRFYENANLETSFAEGNGCGFFVLSSFATLALGVFFVSFGSIAPTLLFGMSKPFTQDGVSFSYSAMWHEVKTSDFGDCQAPGIGCLIAISDPAENVAILVAKLSTDSFMMLMSSENVINGVNAELQRTVPELKMVGKPETRVINGYDTAAATYEKMEFTAIFTVIKTPAGFVLVQMIGEKKAINDVNRAVYDNLLNSLRVEQ